MPLFEVSTPRTYPAGIHPTVAKFESEWPGSQTDGWDASRGTVRSMGFFPGPNGYLGVTIWPWVSPMPTWPVANPQGPGFSTGMKERRGSDGTRRTKPTASRLWEWCTRPAPETTTAIYTNVSNLSQRLTTYCGWLSTQSPNLRYVHIVSHCIVVAPRGAQPHDIMSIM